jgi:hypothetical protein
MSIFVINTKLNLKLEEGISSMSAGTSMHGFLVLVVYPTGLISISTFFKLKPFSTFYNYNYNPTPTKKEIKKDTHIYIL